MSPAGRFLCAPRRAPSRNVSGDAGRAKNPSFRPRRGGRVAIPGRAHAVPELQRPTTDPIRARVVPVPRQPGTIPEWERERASPADTCLCPPSGPGHGEPVSRTTSSILDTMASNTKFPIRQTMAEGQYPGAGCAQMQAMLASLDSHGA